MPLYAKKKKNKNLKKIKTSLPCLATVNKNIKSHKKNNLNKKSVMKTCVNILKENVQKYIFYY